MTDTTLKYYNENGRVLVDRYESAQVPDLHHFLLKAFKAPANLMELGCGSGRDAAFMVKKGFQVTGIDGSKAMVKHALIKHPELSGHLHTLSFPHGLSDTFGSYEGVFSIAALMHLSRPDIDLTLKKVNRLLVPSGRFFFSVPVCRDDVRDDEFDGKGRRFTVMTQQEWTRLCQKHGFKIIRVSTTQDGLGRPGITWMNCLEEKKE